PRGETDGRRGARRGSAGRTRGGQLRGTGGRGRGGPADGDLLEVARVVRRVHRRLVRGDRVPALPVALVHVHRLRGAGRGGGRPGGREDLPVIRGARAVRTGSGQRGVPALGARLPGLRRG